jgi:hypothetical protein
MKMCKIFILISHALPENNVDFVNKSQFLKQTTVELCIQKKSSSSQICNFFEMDFCLVSLKDQFKMCKITIMSCQALQEQLQIFCQKMLVLEQKAAKLNVQNSPSS